VLGVHDELVELSLDCNRVAVLRVLQHKDHKKGKHGGSRVYDELQISL
jgi:hypothetical protein